MSDVNKQEFGSIKELENSKSKWNLTSDLKLLGLLKHTSDDFLSKIQQNLQSFEDLTYKTNSAANKINNLIASILILTNLKFIENRVYDEDIKDITSTTNHNNTTTSKNVNNKVDEEQKLIDRLENSVNVAIKQFSTKYEITKDDFGENNKYNFLHKLYSQKNRFVHKSLPYLIGSDEFLKDTFVGLKLDENDNNPVIDLDQSQEQKIMEEDSVNKYSKITQDSDNLFDQPASTPPICIYNSDDDHVDNKLDLSMESSPKSVPVIENFSENNNSIFERDKYDKNDSIFIESSEDEDIFTRPNIKPKILEENAKTSIDNKDEEHSLFKPALFDDKYDDLFEKDNFKESKESPKQDNLIFSKEDSDEADSIFSLKASRKSVLKTDNVSLFFSSDDDDDDFFTQINKRPEKMSTTKSANYKQNESFVDKEKIKSDSSSDDSKLITGMKIKKNKSKSELSNVINEINSKIQNERFLDQENSAALSHSGNSESIEKQTDDNVDRQSESFAEAIIDDNLGSMLKHKSKLNANRQRKPPSRFQKASLSIHLVAEPIKDNNFDGNSVFSPSQIIKSETEIEPELKSNFSSINAKTFQENKTQEESNTHLVSLESKSKSKCMIESKSLFDSSDDSDDIFKKPNFPTIKNPKPQANTTKKTGTLFSDSDDELDSHPFEPKSDINEESVSTAQNEGSTTRNNKKLQQSKSIFDDDSDSDDLFKF